MPAATAFDHISPSEWIGVASTPEQIANVVQFLTRQKTFDFPSLKNGLFPAAAGIGSDFEATGYRNVWVRDNVHIAFAHYRIGRVQVAAQCVAALATFLTKHRLRFETIIAGSADPADPMLRPHIRFNGEELLELPEKWAHAQNDALGYFLWIYGILVAERAIAVEATDWHLIGLIVRYFAAIHYWQDEDSGHWEETRKISASSIGAVKASLKQWIDTLERHLPEAVDRLAAIDHPVTLAQIKHLHELGDAALMAILPAECRQSDPKKHRRYDGALVFLCYPLSTLPPALHDQVLDEVSQQLSGPNGIRRYHGDSYWCADYKDQLPAEQRSIDLSDDLSSRDRLLKPGTEAQWCIFDPAISCAYGRQYVLDFREGRMRNEATFQKQVHHLQRSLSQLTDRHHPLGAYRCPESYFQQRGTWIPNDLTPLLWTQANLRQALWWMEQSVQLGHRAGKPSIASGPIAGRAVP